MKEGVIEKWRWKGRYCKKRETVRVKRKGGRFKWRKTRMDGKAGDGNEEVRMTVMVQL